MNEDSFVRHGLPQGIPNTAQDSTCFPWGLLPA
jgi:hypothetical protein